MTDSGYDVPDKPGVPKGEGKTIEEAAAELDRDDRGGHTHLHSPKGCCSGCGEPLRFAPCLNCGHQEDSK